MIPWYQCAIWKKNKESTPKYVLVNFSHSFLYHACGNVLSEQLDTAVFSFFEEERSEGRCVRNKDLQEKALELATAMSLPGFNMTY